MAPYEPKTHYQQYEYGKYVACGVKAEKVLRTAQVEEVTCKRCKRLARIATGAPRE